MNSRITAMLVGIGGIIAAFWVGSAVAKGEWIHILLFGLIAIGVVFVSGGYKYSFHILVACVLMDGVFRIGFAISGTEQFLVIAGILVAATAWRKLEQIRLSPELRHWSFTCSKITLGIWLIYVFLHMTIHFTSFENEVLSNIVKSYNSTFTPYLFLLYFLPGRKCFQFQRAIQKPLR